MELSHFGAMTDIDKQIVFKLFELSINRYSEVNEIFCTKDSNRNISGALELTRGALLYSPALSVFISGDYRSHCRTT